MLFETMARSSRLWSLSDESHAVLEGPYHPALRGWGSNVLGEQDLDTSTARRLHHEFARLVQPGILRRAKQDRHDARQRGGSPSPAGWRYAVVRAAATVLRHHPGATIRLLEKTPKNCLRIPFLRALFPDARFVFLRRDPRSTISSLMDGWRAGGRYVSYRLPERPRVAGDGREGWCFVLPAGWRGLLAAPLEEVCAAQWSACVTAVLAELPRLRADGVVYEMAYEDLTARPRETLAALFTFLALPLEPAVLSPQAGALRLVNAVTPPDPHKWRRMNGPAVERILPRVAPLGQALGYDTR
jgi:hypothetical protein